MKILLTVVTAIGMLGLIAGAVLAQSGNELFSQALSKERTEGNMAEAIKLYQNIVDRYPTDHALMARALVQMGLCYEKLGSSAEARKAFDRVLRNYKDQKEPFTKATTRLAELGRAGLAGLGGLIRGRVTDRGQSVFNAQVFALKLVYTDGRRAMMPMGPVTTTTNLHGQYDLSGLRPGKYYVAAVVSERDTGIGVADDGMHVSMYFPGTPDWQKARLVELQAGATIPNVNIDSVPLPVRRVRGTVTGAVVSADAPRNPTVTIGERDLPFPLMTLNATVKVPVDPNGNFEIPRIPPGSYVLNASQIGRYGGSIEIEVRDRDVEGVTIAMTPGFTVTGRIEVEPQVAAAFLAVMLRSDPFVRGAPNYIATPSPNGSFRFVVDQNSRPIQTGDYRVSVTDLLLPPATPQDRPSAPGVSKTAYVKSIRLGEADVLNDGLHLRDQPKEELVIVIGRNPGMIEGQVVNDRRQPLAASSVVLIPEGGIRFRVDHKFTATDAWGRFRLEGVAPGDYKLFAWDSVANGEWQDPDFVRPYESRGKLIHIKEGGQINVEVIGIPPKP